jgi:integrase/recombinase XerD
MSLVTVSDQERAIIPLGTTEEKLIELWMRLKKSAHTQRAYQHDLQLFRQFVKKPLIAVTLEDALDFVDHLDEVEMVNKRGEVKHLEDNSKRRLLNSVKSFYSFAHKTGLFLTNVLASIKPPSAKQAISRRILSEAQVLKMLHLEQDPRNHAILHLLYAAGLRVSELCQLRWRQVVPRTDGIQLDIVGKGDKERHVLLGESTSQVLLPLREDASADMPVFQSRQEVARDGHYKGACLDTTTIFRIVREAAKRAGISNWNEVSPHWLRHCHGSHAIDRKAPLTVVRDTLGHSNISVTNAYVKARPDQSSAHYLPL